MQFQANRKQFLVALNAVGCVVEKRTTLPVLTCVQLTVGNQVVTVAGTDLEIWIQKYVPVSGFSGEPGSLVIPFGIMQKFLTSSKADVVAFEIAEPPAPTTCSKCDGDGMMDDPKDGKLPAVKCQNCDGKGTVQLAQSGSVKITAGATVTVGTFAPESYPVMPEFGSADVPLVNLLEITADAFLDMAEKVKFAISAEESRFTLNGALLEISDKVRLVATDGHRLALVERGQMPEDTKPERALIPKRTLDHLKKVLGKSTETVSILASKVKVTDQKTGEVSTKDGDYIIFSSGSVIVVSRKMSGTFPDFQRVVPRYESEPARVTAKLLIHGIDGIKHCADERSSCIRLRFNCEAVKLHAGSIDRGNASVDVPCRTAAAGGVEVGLNWRYLREFLTVLGDVDLVTIHCAGDPEAVKADDDEDSEEKAEGRRRKRAASSAWLFRSVSDVGFSYILMAMRI